MKVGIISDIHGNHYALKAVLESAKNFGVERLLVLGDIVGYYYHPDQILTLLEEWKYEIIKGNHEEILENLELGNIDPEELKRKYGSGHEQALRKLSVETRKWLYALPAHKSIMIDGVAFQMNHGSPWNIDEYIYPDAPKEKLEACNSPEYDFVLIGHSHYAFSFEGKDSVLINSGSVGQSRQKGGVACWTIVDTSDKSFELIKTEYDVKALIEEVKTIDPEANYSLTILTR